MIAHIGRIAGAILLECEGSYLLIGNTKVPCDWPQQDFVAPAEIDALKNPVQPLERCSSQPAPLGPNYLTITLSPNQTKEDAANIIASRFLITRNGSISDRLWNLILGEDPAPETEATWLLTMPDRLWQIVRETVLRCT